jgi:hypothetical protein
MRQLREQLIDGGGRVALGTANGAFWIPDQVRDDSGEQEWLQECPWSALDPGSGPG